MRTMVVAISVPWRLADPVPLLPSHPSQAATGVDGSDNVDNRFTIAIALVLGTTLR